MMRLQDRASDIAETISGRDYLTSEYGTDFHAGDIEGQWKADRCPLCDSEDSFVLEEAAKRRADWRCSLCPTTRATSGPLAAVDSNHGDLVTLVALKERVSQPKAASLIREWAKNNQVADARTPALERTQSLELACKLFRLQLSKQKKVVAYLEERKVDWQKLRPDFEIGGNDLELHEMEAYLRHVPDAMNRLRQGQNPLISCRSFALSPAVVAPLREGDGRFVGLQLRGCQDDLVPRYVTKGLTAKEKDRFLYAQHLDATKKAIATQSLVFVCKGVFDCWVLHQEGQRNAVATLSPGMTQQQYERVSALKTEEIVLGFTSEKEIGIARALCNGGLDRVLTRINGEQDFSNVAGEPGAIADMIRRRVDVMEAGQRATGQTLVRQSHRQFREESEAGRYFVVAIKDLDGMPASSLVKALERARQAENQHARGYIKVPHNFVDNGRHVDAGAALRLLMHLHSKKTGQDRPVSIKLETIAKGMGLSESAVNKQAKKLRELGLLVSIPPSPESPKNAWDWYPLFMPVKE